MPPVTTKISSKQLLEEIILRSVVEVLEASRQASFGNDLKFVLDTRILHRNTSLVDLPEHLRKAVQETTQSMMGYIYKEGFVLQPKESK